MLDENHNRPEAVIVYIVGIFTIIVALLCIGVYLYNKQPPRIYREIQQELHQRIQYAHYYGKDFRYIKPGEQSIGNCATFAYSAVMDLTSRNIPAYIKLCTIQSNQEPHAYAYTDDGYAFDVRFKDITTIEETDCK